MPKRKVRKPLKRSTNANGAEVNFTFFILKLFISLIAVALIVIAFAVISAINNSSTPTGQESYRIDTSNLETDPSANQVLP